MTVLQFKPRQTASVPSKPDPIYTPAQYAKAWMCVAIGLYISPWIQWLNILSEDVQSGKDSQH